MSNLSLYQLSSEYLQVMDDLADPVRDLPPEVIRDTLESVAGDLEEKAINLAKFIRNLEANAEAIKAAETDMAQRRKSLENRANWLRNYLKTTLEVTKIAKIDSPWFRLSVAKNPPAVELLNEAQIPAKFKHTETVTTTDKAAIKTALLAGENVPGTKLTNGTRLSIK